MHVQNIRVQKNAMRTLESLVFQKLPKDPTPLQIIRHKRQERLSRFCALVLAVVMLVGIGAQIGKIVDVAMAKKNIRALQADNRLLEVTIGNLEIELMMKTQDSVVCHLAARDLGMIKIDMAKVLVLPVANEHSGDVQLVSNGYQQ